MRDALASVFTSRLPVHAGDIVDVGTTPPRLMAHWMYETVTTIVKVGASIPLI